MNRECLCHPSLKNFNLSYTYNKYTKKLKCNRYNDFLLRHELIKEVEINKRDLSVMTDRDLLKLFEFTIVKTTCPLHTNCDLLSLYPVEDQTEYGKISIFHNTIFKLYINHLIV